MARRESRILAAIIVLLGTTLALSAAILRRPADVLAKPLDALPLQLGTFKAAYDARIRDDIAGALTPTSYLSRVYSSGRDQLRLFIAYYAQQKAGEAMHSPKNCLPGGGWEIWKKATVPVRIPAGEVSVNYYSIRKGTEALAVLYWYQSKDRIIASEYQGKLALMRDALTLGRTSGSIVIVTVNETPEAVEQGRQFSERLIPALAECFR